MLRRGAILLTCGLLGGSLCGAGEENTPTRSSPPASVRIVGPLALIPPGANCRVELRPLRTQNWDGTVEQLEWYSGTFQPPGDGTVRLAAATQEAQCNLGGWPTKIPSLSRFYRSTGMPATPVAGGSAAVPVDRIQTITIAAAPAARPPQTQPAQEDSDEPVTLLAPLEILSPGMTCEVALSDDQTSQKGWVTTTQSRGYGGRIEAVEPGRIMLKDVREIQTTRRKGIASVRSTFKYPEVQGRQVTVPVAEILEIRILSLAEKTP